MDEPFSAADGAGAGSGVLQARVFISYASADAPVANRVCEYLESHGVACWIAPRNVRPGEVYADAIVTAINACRSLVVVISEKSVLSGHVFREVERAGSKNRPIISLRVELVPLPPALEYFLSASHWLDADGVKVDRALPQLVEALRGQFAGPANTMPRAAAARPPSRSRNAVLALALVAALGLAYVVADKVRSPKPIVATPPTPATPAPAPAPFLPPPHSVAGLPFVNLSGDPKDEYFSDGLSVELLEALATIRELQVAARTSSFSFKGKAVEITEIARRLNVGAILEGSIRKDAKHVRIAANLIDATSGFRLWSNSFDRDLKDIFNMQSEIATAVTTSLQATLMAHSAALVEVGGTHNPQAFDAYLRGEKMVGMALDAAGSRAQLAAYDDAISLDPRFAKAYVSKALALVIVASNSAATEQIRADFEKARLSARTAVALADGLGEAHSTLGFVLDAGFQDYSTAAAEYERALSLAPGNSRVLLMSARFLSEIGRSDAAVANAQRAAVLDPLNAGAYRILGLVLLYAHHYRDAVLACDRALRISPQAVQAAANRGIALMALGEFGAARESCSTQPVDWLSHTCLAIALHKLNRDAEAQSELALLRADAADETDQAYQYAEIYAQWGDRAQALGWLETAYRVRDPGLVQLKVDYLMDPIRDDPRFASILGRMKFPD
jgi:TolB-like protein/tetratricopeptide (TPR) repeat protein